MSRVNPVQLGTRKTFGLISITLIGCLVLYLIIVQGKGKSALTYDGKSLGYWYKQAIEKIPQGNEKDILPAVEKMGTETVPFWLERLQEQDTAGSRAYYRFWYAAPKVAKALLPVPIAPSTRRNVAHFVLSKQQFTNGIPELIQLSYSKDKEVQYYAVHLLWWRAYQFYNPSSECIAAFCSALQNGDVRTRRMAIYGLNILPVKQQALATLEMALKDPEEEVRIKAAIAIMKLKPDADFTPIFQAGITSINPNVRASADVGLYSSNRNKDRKSARNQ